VFEGAAGSLGLLTEVAPSWHLLDWITSFSLLPIYQTIFDQVGVQVLRLIFFAFRAFSVFFEHSFEECLPLFRVNKRIIIEMVKTLSSETLAHQAEVTLFRI